MDASEFKEYIFGALFLKRASDVFDEERQRVVADQLAKRRSEAEAEQRAEDRDFYSEAFFVPELARWEHLRDDLHHQVGDGLNKALAALEEANESLEGVLQHIDFNRRVGNTTVSDKKWRDLIMHFSKYRLRNSDFEFPDLLGAAYEYLVRDFADSASKKGGEFYTLRPVVQLMVRLLDPQEGMSVYDPCAGSGGMLIYARNHVADNGGNADNLRLAGQENNGTTWSISKMNMLLHRIRDADLRNEDTLASPEHIRDGELERFDRVITNPPFSQNYDRAGLAHPQRFVYGYTPEDDKKADLMFLQHMLAVLKPEGIVATVMPHGVLFRGGAEATIRRGIIEDDLLDTVIGLGPNLFYGTGIPATILILRAKSSKPPDRIGERERPAVSTGETAHMGHLVARSCLQLLPVHVSLTIHHDSPSSAFPLVTRERPGAFALADANGPEGSVQIDHVEAHFLHGPTGTVAERLRLSDTAELDYRLIPNVDLCRVANKRSRFDPSADVQDNGEDISTACASARSSSRTRNDQPRRGSGSNTKSTVNWPTKRTGSPVVAWSDSRTASSRRHKRLAAERTGPKRVDCKDASPPGTWLSCCSGSVGTGERIYRYREQTPSSPRPICAPADRPPINQPPLPRATFVDGLGGRSFQQQRGETPHSARAPRA